MGRRRRGRGRVHRSGALADGGHDHPGHLHPVQAAPVGEEGPAGGHSARRRPLPKNCRPGQEAHGSYAAHGPRDVRLPGDGERAARRSGHLLAGPAVVHHCQPAEHPS